MKIDEIMTTKIVTVEMDDTLQTISDIFQHVEFHHLPVVDNNKLHGIISDRDLLKATSPFLHTLAEQSRDYAVLNKKAHQIMTRNPITVSPDTEIDQAVKILLENSVSCLPIVDDNFHIIGIVTWKDLVRIIIKY